MFESNEDTTGGVQSDESPERSEPDPEVGDEGSGESRREDVEELSIRLGELEEDLERNESSIRAVRSSQEEMSESVDEIHDTVRRLLGVYDQLAADANPFADGGTGGQRLIEGRDPTADDPRTADDASRANGHADAAGDDTIDGVAGDGVGSPANGRGGGPADAGSVDDAGRPDDAGAGETVSFDDLVDESESGFEWGNADGDSRSTDDGSESPDESATDGDGAAASKQDGALADVPAGYAGEVLVMEWLATLMERSGPAGALRAVDHYEELGWIDPDVRERLVDTLGGPGLDAHVDPNRPVEPTAADHEASHVYVRTLDRLHDL